MESSLSKEVIKSTISSDKHKTGYIITSLPLSLVVLAFVVVCFVFTLDFPK